MRLDPTVENLLDKVKNLQIQSGIKDNQVNQYRELVERLEVQNSKLIEKCEVQNELLNNYRELCGKYEEAINLLGGWEALNKDKA